MKPLRVLHCPLGIAGNAQSLARAERELGLESWAVTMWPHPFGYPSDEIMCQPQDGSVRIEIARWKLLRRALRDFDIIHYNFGQTIFPMWDSSRGSGSPLKLLYRTALDRLNIHDLSLLQRAGKGIVVTFQGDDARQGDRSRALFETCIAREVEPGYYRPEEDEAKRRTIARFERVADRIFYLNPDLAWFLPRQAQFMPYAHIDLREWCPCPPAELPERPVVLHAPSHRGAKGTCHIEDAVRRLRNEGIPFEYVLVEGLPHHEVRRLYQRADLLVDQLLAGWYGGVAVELMALGKPVIAYIRDGDLGVLPTQMRAQLPIIAASPANIYDTLKEWLTVRRHELRQRGVDSRKFVEDWHDSRMIAATLELEYDRIVTAKGQKATH